MGIKTAYFFASVVKGGFFKNNVSSYNVAILFKSVAMLFHTAPLIKILINNIMLMVSVI